ncbi:MAG: hypothetical protein LBL04_10410 [Bacteroidales bacterium]|jgi:hypothetical protein|nr:hypothetical protein [Bacteroidales bacterium]
MKAKINRIITALLEIQSKGYFDVSFDYTKKIFLVQLFKRKPELHQFPEYYERVDMTDDRERESHLEKIFNMVEALKTVPTKDTNNVMIVPFQCYRHEFVKGEKSGDWKKILPIIEYGANATQLTEISGLGYYINDPDNEMQYSVSTNQLNETFGTDIK